MSEWLASLDLNSLILGLSPGLMLALVFWVRATRASRELSINQARLDEQQKHFEKEKSGLEEAEKRLTESFERLA